MLMKSPKMRDVTIAYIEREFLENQKLEITKKLFRVVKRWIQCGNNKSFESFHDLCSYIEENPKFKLPWNIVESEMAGKQFLSWFNINKHSELSEKS